jgi:acetyl-CoA synthetase
MTELAWQPTSEVIARANLTRLIRRHGLAGYQALLARSREEPEWFWPAVIEDLGLHFSTPFVQVVDSSRGIEWPRWFIGGRLNVAANCVHRWAEDECANREAVIGIDESGVRTTLTFGELSREVTRLAEGLASLGVQAGDRVALFLPWTPAAATASHACAHLGAIQVPIFSGLSAPAVAERLMQSGATVVLTVDATFRRGNRVAMKEVVDEAAQATPSVRHVAVLNRPGEESALRSARDVSWRDLVSAMPGTLEPVQVDSEHPYLIAYTSGTTGRPKGAVHVQGGFLVKIASEAGYQADLHRGDRILFVTDLGWLMGPWTLVGAGAAGATVVLLEGAPDWPQPDRLWQACAEERADVLGLSPTLVRALAPHGDDLPRQHDLSTLRTFVTTGEAWNPAPYRWLHEVVGGGERPIINISGGTEVGACFLSCVHVEPIKECSLGFPALGMAVDCVGPGGASLLPGEVGELVCRAPWPAMTRGFWDDRERYLDTYWRTIPGMWVHGDFASVDADGHWYLHGRSDDTLNIAGKRVGPAELESAAVGHPAVQEAAAVGIPHPVKGEVPWLFCVPADLEPPAGLELEIRSNVVRDLGKAFAPERVLLVAALPHTRSQKIVRRAVRAAALGLDPGDVSSIENLDALTSIASAARGSTPRR